MAINPPNMGALSVQAGQIVLNARSSIQQIIFFNDYIQSLGQTGLVNLGFSADDATLMLNVYTNLAAVANVCMGAAYTGPPLPFNFLAETIPMWAGN